MRIAAVLTGLHWIIGPGRPRNWIPTTGAAKAGGTKTEANREF
jgi:hypothetical protein